jgi:hypothetical protein
LAAHHASSQRLDLDSERALQFLFALEGVRAPYPNEWTGKLGSLEPLVLDVARTANLDLQQRLCKDAATLAAAHGYVDVYAGWEGEIETACWRSTSHGRRCLVGPPSAENENEFRKDPEERSRLLYASQPSRRVRIAWIAASQSRLSSPGDRW